MRAAEDAVAVLDPVADDATAAVLADGRELLDRALERVERPARVQVADLQGPSIVVATDVTSRHRVFLPSGPGLSSWSGAPPPRRAVVRREAGSPPRRWPQSRSRCPLRSCSRTRAARPRSPRARGAP